jgi:hypothetical protein
MLELPEIPVDAVDIPDSVTVAELLRKTIDAVFPVSEGDRVIIETTGGYRNAITALTLFSRFLRYSGISVEFSTFSDFQSKKVADTRESDDMFDLLDAVNLFATTGNAQKIDDLFSKSPLTFARRKKNSLPRRGNFTARFCYAKRQISNPA